MSTGLSTLIIQDDCQPDELGYLVTKDARSKGIATRASLLVMDYAFSVLRRPSLHMTIKAGNAPSLRIAEKLKFTKTGSIVSPACGGTTSTILLFWREAPHIHRVPIDGLTGTDP